MTAGATYVPIQTQTASGSVNTITFSSIPSTYTDLRIVISAGETGGGNGAYIIFNNDGGSGSLYSFTRMVGNGSTATSTTAANRNTNTWVLSNGIADPTTPTDVSTIDVMSYANTNVYKTALNRENNAASGTVGNVILWRNTAAINRIDIIYSAANFATGSTFTLYGISSA